ALSLSIHTSTTATSSLSLHDALPIFLRQDSRSRLRPGLSPGRPAPAAVAGTAVVPVKPVRAAPLASLPVAPLGGQPRRDFLAGRSEGRRGGKGCGAGW